MFSHLFKPFHNWQYEILLKYNQEETVVVEIICKVHAPSTRIAKAVVYHEGQEIQTNVWNSELNIR